jgi:hypothetical protein
MDFAVVRMPWFDHQQCFLQADTPQSMMNMLSLILTFRV